MTELRLHRTKRLLNRTERRLHRTKGLRNRTKSRIYRRKRRFRQRFQRTKGLLDRRKRRINHWKRRFNRAKRWIYRFERRFNRTKFRFHRTKRLLNWRKRRFWCAKNEIDHLSLCRLDTADQQKENKNRTKYVFHRNNAKDETPEIRKERHWHARIRLPDQRNQMFAPPPLSGSEIVHFN